MVAILGTFIVADILVQSQHLGIMDGGVIAGNSLALYSVLMIIQVLTGRVMPFFTRVVVPDTQVIERPLLEKVLLITLVLLALADVLMLDSLIISLLAGILLVAHLMRVLPWFSKPVLNTPILWVLYAGYFWLLIGFAMKMLVGFNLVTKISATIKVPRIATIIRLLHCFTFMIGCATANAKKKKKEISTTAINSPGAGVKGKIRANNQTPANTAKGVWLMVSTLVQFLTAVNKKPAITAAA